MIEAKGVTKSYGFGESKADILKGFINPFGKKK